MCVFDKHVLFKPYDNFRLTCSNCGQPPGSQVAAQFPQHRHGNQYRVHQVLGQRYITALLGEQYKIQFIHSKAAVFFRNCHPRQAHLNDLLPQGRIPAILRFPTCPYGFRRYLIDQEIPDRFPEQ